MPRFPPLDVAYTCSSLKENQYVSKLDVLDVGVILANLLRHSETHFDLLNRLFGGDLFCIPGKLPLNEFLIDTFPAYDVFLLFRYASGLDSFEDLLFEYSRCKSSEISIPTGQIISLIELFYVLIRSLSSYIVDKYDVIIINASNIPSAITGEIIASYIREDDPYVRIIGIGNVWGMRHIIELLLKRGSIDYAIYYKYEFNTSPLITALSKGEVRFDIPNLIYKKESNLYQTKVDLNINLELLPIPDFSFFNLNLYSQLSNGILTLPIEGSRGCNNTCNFCVDRKIFSPETGCNLFWTAKTPSRIVKEIKEYLHFKPSKLIFTDLTFNMHANWLNEVLDALYEERLDLLYGCNLRVDLLKHEHINKFRKTNFFKVILGIETFSEKSVDMLRKSLDSHNYVALAKKMLFAFSRRGLLRR